MKLKNIRIKKYKLLRLYLYKYEAYKINKPVLFSYENILDRLELSLKKVLLLIYNYHIFNKTILFIGLPYYTDKNMVQVLDKSNHIFLPKSVWDNGLLVNKGFLSKKYRNLVYFKRLLDLKDNPHLIVVFTEEKLLNLISEAKKLSIPIIYFGNLSIDLDDILYKVEGNFSSNKMKNFCQFLFYSILKRSKKSNSL
jgi:hypothetical protein